MSTLFSVGVWRCSSFNYVADQTQHNQANFKNWWGLFWSDLQFWLLTKRWCLLSGLCIFFKLEKWKIQGPLNFSSVCLCLPETSLSLQDTAFPLKMTFSHMSPVFVPSNLSHFCLNEVSWNVRQLLSTAGFIQGCAVICYITTGPCLKLQMSFKIKLITGFQMGERCFTVINASRHSSVFTWFVFTSSATWL